MSLDDSRPVLKLQRGFMVHEATACIADVHVSKVWQTVPCSTAELCIDSIEHMCGFACTCNSTASDCSMDCCELQCC